MRLAPVSAEPLDGEMTWREDFEPDGALRDIVIQETTTRDWNAVLRVIESRYRPFKFVGSEETRTEIDCGALFLGGENRPLLLFDVGDTDMACHFFGESEIEFDFYPNEVKTEEQLSPLLTFLHEIESAAGKTAIITHENIHDAVIFQFSPQSGVVHFVANSTLPDSDRCAVVASAVLFCVRSEPVSVRPVGWLVKSWRVVKSWDRSSSSDAAPSSLFWVSVRRSAVAFSSGVVASQALWQSGVER